jgi:hypothetical protein
MQSFRSKVTCVTLTIRSPNFISGFFSSLSLRELGLFQTRLFFENITKPVSIMANPVKAGDAKLWVYSHLRDHDCQAAENDVSTH